VSIYLRPTGFLHNDSARLAVGEKMAAFIGGGQTAFCMVELIEKGGQGSVRTFADLRQSRDKKIRALLKNITSPRNNVAGITMDKPRIVGIVNVTPDSFSDGGDFFDPEKAVKHGEELIAAGADILDVGGESTRPGAASVVLENELYRVLPVIGQLKKANIPISVDTRKAVVMARAFADGARMINDVSALTHDPDAPAVAARSKAHVILMHARGSPENMQDDPQYEYVLTDIYDYLAKRIKACITAGIDCKKIIIDPGIGFGKTLEHNLQILRGVSIFHGLGVPVMLGTSRKRFIGEISGEKAPKSRDAGSLATMIAGVRQGVQLLRVHNVLQTRQAVDIYTNI
jgi:dihydropteroate synthase